MLPPVVPALVAAAGDDDETQPMDTGVSDAVAKDRMTADDLLKDKGCAPPSLSEFVPLPCDYMVLFELLHHMQAQLRTRSVVCMCGWPSGYSSPADWGVSGFGVQSW